MIDATATTLYPGGILNRASPSPGPSSASRRPSPRPPRARSLYATTQINNGDQTCKSNQVLHGEAASLIDKIHANSHYIPSVADPLDPISVRQQDQGPGVHGVPVRGRADRAGTAPTSPST